ncbi:hypothetical protein QUF81_00950 [Peribacillus simplex]|uniref:hypothetical protein n=1 Tax=Peribacillus TaxID=2675229 RepID=UPI0022816A7C|nr:MULTISPECIES: hypothetical protein [Peribacillus]MCY8940233.1 hypothetical protein [Peribacillus frigoritolerans]MDM5291858.1 hypothetical protein [Peribacillus simplex]
MRIFKMFSMCILMIIFLNACSLETTKTKNKILEIPNEDEYTTLLVQGVDEDGVSSESTSKVITDINDIQAFIEKVNKMEVVQPPNKELLEKSKELNKKGNYFFVLSDKETMDNKVYTMNFFSDGRIMFQEPNGKKQEANGAGQKMMYLSKEKHSDVLLEMKELLNIKF